MIILTSFVSSLTLYTGVPLDNTYENTYTTTSLLSGFTHDTIGNSYYRIRPDKNTVKIEHSGNMNVAGIGGTTLNLYSCNYMSFINGQHENRRFYCFITDVRYISDYTAEIDFEIDVMMTWLKHGTGTTGAEFDTCFIEREHTDSDEIGEHLIDEGLNIGSYLCEEVPYSGGMVIVIMMAGKYDGDYPNGQWRQNEFGVQLQITDYYVQSAYTPYTFYDTGVGVSDYGDVHNPFPTIANLFNSLSNDQHATSEWVKAVYYAPQYSIAVPVDRPTEFRDLCGTNFYKPNNNKLYTYPYMCVEVNNNCGVANDYRFEFGYNGRLTFLVDGIALDSSLTCRPQGYKQGRYNNIMNKNDFPVMSASSSEYNNYMTEKKAKMGGELASNVLSPLITNTLIGGGPAVGAVASGMNLLNYVVDSYTKGEVAKTKSSSAIGGLSGLSYFAGHYDGFKFTFLRKTILYEYAKSIDDFFTKFGYKVNVLAKPSMTYSSGATRTLNWKYIKTIGCALNGDCPSSAQSKICEIMDNGITFWKTKDVGDYTFPTQGGE